MNIPPRLALAAVFVGVLGHASSEFVAKASGVSGPELSVWRYLLGGAGLVLLALPAAGPRALLAPLRESPWELTWLSLAGVSGAYLAFHWALDFASPIQVATLVTTIPIFVGLANLILNGQRLTAVKIVTGLAAVAGLALLITDGLLDKLLAGRDSIWGVLLALACAVLAAFYAVRVKPLIARHGALPVTAVSLMIGGVGLWLGVALAFGVAVDPRTLFDRPPAEAAWIATLALWNTTITQFLWIGGLAAAADITRASYLFFLKPVIAAALAMAFLGTPLSALQALAIAAVTGSVLVELFWPRLAGRARG
ncbi:DMT family transporter [Oceanicella actignis]|uniref:DMT family transporter n=1 Tax=Oceanicella actignis TaxID=1189325 RepID=UPI0011E77DE4|nr:DMT family transporter [Oceanicella actignis]TYO90667.1 EamA-like transporter family protein [Oceanicella actignis]